MRILKNPERATGIAQIFRRRIEARLLVRDGNAEPRPLLRRSFYDAKPRAVGWNPLRRMSSELCEKFVVKRNTALALGALVRKRIGGRHAGAGSLSVTGRRRQLAHLRQAATSRIAERSHTSRERRRDRPAGSRRRYRRTTGTAVRAGRKRTSGSTVRRPAAAGRSATGR